MRAGGGAGGMGGAMGGRAKASAASAMGSTTQLPPMGASAGYPADPSDRYRQVGGTVPLGAIADVRVVSGPPMIKDENGVLVGYVFADIDAS